MQDRSTATTKRETQVYLDLLSPVFDSGKPLAKLIDTDAGYFLYDTGTNKILGCNEETAVLLQTLFSHDVSTAHARFSARFGETTFIRCAAEIMEAVNKENILKVKKATRFGLSDHFGNIGDILNTAVQSVCLELTQACNNRCLYCPYSDFFKGKRDHGEKVMSLETAKRAIDFLKAHSPGSESVAIGFYGGEPVLQFELLKTCTAYAGEVFKGKTVRFNMTTNAALMTPGMARYFMENDFSVVVSLDGPQEIHDMYRKDKSGKGSYAKTIAGLKMLAHAHAKTKKGRISINAVYMPPYSEEKIDKIHGHIKSLEWLPDVVVTTVYPSDGTIPENMIPENGLVQDKNLKQWAVEKYLDDPRNANTMVKGVVEKKFAKLIQRPVFKEPVAEVFLNGCCIPGERKSFVSTDGAIHVCEKIAGHAPAIGHVEKGFDFETIKKVYIEDYAERSIADCSQCWASRVCDLCYIAAFNEDGNFDIMKKRKTCQTMVIYQEQILRSFVTLLRKNPGKLGYLYHYGLK